MLCLTPFTMYDCMPKSSVYTVVIMLVSPYLTVRNIMPFVLCVIVLLQSKDITVKEGAPEAK